jgi:hypothetical protein
VTKIYRNESDGYGVSVYAEDPKSDLPFAIYLYGGEPGEDGDDISRELEGVYVSRKVLRKLRDRMNKLLEK